MELLRKSNWKHRYLYICRNSRYGRTADTIILRYAITPNGRSSKYYAMIRINGNHIPQPTDEQLARFAESIRLPNLPKGYTWSEPYLY